jgi:zinc protease
VLVGPKGKGARDKIFGLMSLLAVWAPALLLMIVGSACSVVRSSSSSVAAAPAPIRALLPNGIPVIVQEHQGGDVVALQLWVRAGARDETASELGLAHYLEHMLFKGTATRPPGFVDRDVEGVGGRINAATSWDYTYYHALLPAARAVAGIEMLADVAVNASLDATLLDQEKQVVLEEMRINEDNPNRFLSLRLFADLFPGHPYGRQVIGTADLVRGLTRDTLAAFYRRHYVPQSFALVVVGAVRPDEVVAAAGKAFGHLPRTDFRRLPTPPAAAPRAHTDTIVRPGAAAYLGMAWPAPRLDAPDTPAVDLLVTILGQKRSSRLVQALRERTRLVSSVRTGFAAMEGAGAVILTAQVEPAKLAAAESAVLSELHRVREEGVTEAERLRAVTGAEAQRAFSKETVEGHAVMLGRGETTWTLADELAYVRRLRAVTADEIRAAARRYLDLDRYVRIALVPPGASR